MKKCSRCRRVLADDQFYWRNKANGTRQHNCRECQAIYAASHYRRNVSAYVAKAQRSNVKFRQKIADLVASYKIKCVDCGEDHPAVLDFHHLDPATKEATIASMWSLKRILREMEKCIVLCANCHRKRHWRARKNRSRSSVGIEQQTTNLQAASSSLAGTSNSLP